MMAADLDGLRPEDLVEETGSTGDPLVGRVLQGRYEVRALVARGGMGKIYRAEQVPLGRPVALKVLDLGYSQDHDPEFRKRFFLEAATSARLAHPNTIRIFDYGHEGDIFFIAMEFIEGRTLLRIIKDEAPLPPLRVVHIARQMCWSLHEAHGLDVIHRDLKPSNVLITQHGDLTDYVKVLDFGLVKLLKDDEEMTKSGLFLGSPNYMSPEQIRAKGVDQRSDIYSLGVILYRALTATIPFRRDSSMSTLIAQLEDDPPSFAHAAPGIAIPEVMEAIVMRCLDKEPARRFASVQELDRALAAAADVLRDGPPAPEPSLVPGRTRPPVDPSTADTAEMPQTAEPTPAPPRKRRRRPKPEPTGPIDAALSSPRLPLVAGAAIFALAAVLVLLLVVRAQQQRPPPPAPVQAHVVAPARLASAPPGAVVLRGEEYLGTTPTTVEVPADERWEVTLQKLGHVPETILLGAGENRAVMLVPIAEAAPEPAATPAPTRTTRPRRDPAPRAEATPEPTPERRRSSDLRDPWSD